MSKLFLERRRSWHKWLQAERLGPQIHWPRSIRNDMFGKHHLSNPRRFAVLLFLLGNGLVPRMARWYMFECFVLDKEAKRQITWILDHWQEKVLSGQWSYWDLTEGKSSNR